MQLGVEGTEEANHRLSGSVSVVYALEGEAARLQIVITVQGEEMSHASSVNEDMKASWNQLSDINASLRSQLLSVDIPRSMEQQDEPMLSPEDEHVKGELAAGPPRESIWKSELHTTRIEVQQYESETNAQRQVSADELRSMRESYLRSTSEYSEARALFQASRSKLEVVDKTSCSVEG